MSDTPQPKVMDGANYDWCPALRSKKHAYGQWHRVGNSWHGPVSSRECTQCHYQCCDH